MISLNSQKNLIPATLIARSEAKAHHCPRRGATTYSPTETAVPSAQESLTAVFGSVTSPLKSPGNLISYIKLGFESLTIATLPVWQLVSMDRRRSLSIDAPGNLISYSITIFLHLNIL